MWPPPVGPTESDRPWEIGLISKCRMETLQLSIRVIADRALKISDRVSIRALKVSNRVSLF